MWNCREWVDVISIEAQIVYIVVIKAMAEEKKYVEDLCLLITSFVTLICVRKA